MILININIIINTKRREIIKKRQSASVSDKQSNFIIDNLDNEQKRKLLKIKHEDRKDK